MKITEAPDGTVTVDTGRESAVKAGTWDGETISARVLKAEAERRYTLNVVYPAHKADVAQAADGYRDFASKAVVEDAAWGYMQRFREVGTYHSPEAAAAAGTAAITEGAAELVESYIYRGPDWAIKAADGSQVMIREGDWLAGFIWSPDAWADVQTGRIGGVSPEGRARRRKPSPEALAELRP